jgi:2-polyprenyl-3-methyl-5-hydroxy-6-metoxy-1,4-benzoquinol methylase
MYTYTNCPICKNNSFKDFITCKDYTVSGESFTIVSCTSCKFKFTNPIPDIQDLGNYYKSEDYISHSNTKRGIISKLYHIVRSYTLKEKVKLISSYVPKGIIIDYGSGTGMFLKTCKESGWSAFGMEPDKDAREVAHEFGVQSFSSKDELNTVVKDLSASAITLWHVLEHVTYLDETLKFFNSKLQNQGILAIAVPNYKSEDANFYAEHWAAYDVPRHLYHFDKVTMEMLLSKHGFNLIKTKPMLFDSFYVSLLSEKYKTGANNPFKAFITGLKSNIRAKSSSEYSSLIYIFKKK